MADRKYGIEKFGRLRTVMLHQPSTGMEVLTPENYPMWLFDELPDIDRFCAEHAAYADLLSAHGVEVLELADHVVEQRELMHRLPNLCYMHDSSVISSKGAILSKMSYFGRRREEIVVKEALRNLEIPLFHEFGDDDEFEGCLLFAPDLLFIAKTERHSARSIERFIPRALSQFREILYAVIPEGRRFMHPDVVLNRVREDLALVFLPGLLRTYRITAEKREEVDVQRYMAARGVELINVSDDEQRRWGTTFVPLEPGTIFHYDIALKPATQRTLARRGVKIIEFHPDALLAGGGSLRCLTLRIWRE